MRRLEVCVPTLMLLLVISGALAQTRKPAAEGPNPDEPAIHDYILTVDKVKEYADVSKKMEAAEHGDPVLAAEMKKVRDSDVSNLQKAAMLERSPHAAAFLKSNGMTARDFVLTPMTAFTAAMAIAAQDMKGSPLAFVNPVNIQFVRDHKAELEKYDLFSSDESSDKSSDKDKDKGKDDKDDK